jgi:hypothetical protein
MIALAGVFLWPERRGDLWAESLSVVSVRIDLAKGAQPLVEQLLTDQGGRFSLISAETSRQGASLDLCYSARLRPGTSPASLIRDINAIDGVQSVGIRAKD